MPNWLERLTGRFKPEARDTDIAVLRSELAVPAQKVEISTLVPVLVSSEIAKTGMFPGPVYLLAVQELAQAWGVLGRGTVVRYMNRDMQRHWERQGIPWRERAASNLRVIAESEPFNDAYRRDDGTVVAVKMLYPQDLAPARLLVRGLLDQTFPDGYVVALPHPTCVLAIASCANASEWNSVDAFIARCGGAEPFATGMFKPELFWETVSDDIGSTAAE